MHEGDNSEKSLSKKRDLAGVVANISVSRFIIVSCGILCLVFQRYDAIVFISLAHNTCLSDRDSSNRNCYPKQWFNKSLLESN